MEKEVKMISTVSAVLDFKRKNPGADSEKILRYVADFVSKEKDYDTKISMMATGTKAVSIIERNPRLSEREVIKKIVELLPEINSNIY